MDSSRRDTRNDPTRSTNGPDTDTGTDKDTGPDTGEPRRSACAPPERDGLARAVDKAHVFASLFGGAQPAVMVDRFTLIERIGRGAVGEVYAAYDARLDRKVAIKMLRARADGPGRAPGDLLREARNMARVRHRNVIQVHEVGTCAGQVYIAMEYVRGTTLREWTRTQADGLARKARYRAILGQFIGAGRGLAAVHAAGLVHRDFKPDNVLVDEHEEARVGDFGLARVLARERAGAAGVARDGDAGPEPGTLTAAVAGTPRYMAPEQWRGDAPDARSDQFGFCVALLEMLLGEAPLSDGWYEDLASMVRAGAGVRARAGARDEARDEDGDEARDGAGPEAGSAARYAPRLGELPARVRAALTRGLALAPEERFPDMGALLAALERALKGGARWLSPVLVALVLVGVAGYGYATPDAVDPCAGVGASMDEVWNDGRRAELARGFGRAGVPGAEDSWRALGPELARHAAVWKRERLRGCEATHVHGTRSVEMLDRHGACLSRVRSRMAGLLDTLDRVLAGPEPGDGIAMAPRAVADLPAPDGCDDETLLRHGMEPASWAHADAVAGIRATLDRARALELLGRRDQAMAWTGPALAAAEAIGYGPVRAEALFQAGRLESLRGTHADVTRGHARIHQAVNLAAEARHDELVVEGLAFALLTAYRNPGHERDEAGVLARALAASRRIGERPLDRAKLLRREGLLLARDGRREQALARQQEALAVLDERDDAPWLYRATHLHDLGNTLRDMGRYEDARERHEAALALLSQLGPDHPYALDVRHDMARAAFLEGRLDQARAAFTRLLDARIARQGGGHPDVGQVYLELANIDQQRNALDAAETSVEAALAIFQASPAAHDPRLAQAHEMGGVLRYRRRDFEGAHAWYERALNARLMRLGPNHPDVGQSHVNLAETEIELGDGERAQSSYAEARRILGEPAHPVMAGFLRGVHGRLLLVLGRGGEAVPELLRALGHLRRDNGRGAPVVDAPLELAAVHWALARAYAMVDGKRSERALEQARMALGLLEKHEDEVSLDADGIRRFLAGR